jgi:trk system potassium uptake protein TrkA
LRIVIIGAGQAGQQLAKRLCAEKHDVIMVDIHEAPLHEMESQLDVMTVVGPGSSPRALEEAEISKADLLVAVTSRDEVNILSCLLAHAAGVPHKVARIADTDYARENGPYALRRMGIDLVVSQKEECAHDLFNVLRMPGTIEVVDVLNERAIVVGIKVDMDSPLAMTTLSGFPKNHLIDRIRIIALQRADEVLIPRGDTQFLIGDDVYMVGEPGDILQFLEWAYPDRPHFQKIVIAGGGDLGLHLAHLLETIDAEVLMLEPDSERAEFCADRLNRTLVIKNSPLDPATFEDIGVTSKTAFVAVTDDDENNIISCLMAEKRGACFTAAQVTKTGYAPIITSLSLMDRAVNPYTSMINAISRFIKGTNIESAATLYNLQGELLEARIPEDSPWLGKTIKDIGALKYGIIGMVMRGDELLPATGELQLTVNDRLVLFSLPRASDKILAALRGK